jgi:hypothetical protein
MCLTNCVWYLVFIYYATLEYHSFLFSDFCDNYCEEFVSDSSSRICTFHSSNLCILCEVMITMSCSVLGYLRSETHS